MSATLSPNSFAIPSFTQRVTLTLSGSHINLMNWNFNGPATYRPTALPIALTWTVSNWFPSSPSQATFSLNIPSLLPEDGVGGSPGTLTVTGTDGSNTQPIPVPCSTT